MSAGDPLEIEGGDALDALEHLVHADLQPW